MKKIVIYPGRFQPMLPHHAGVYQHLQAQFPEADVYISTSDKVEGTKSAFNFKEKVAIMTDMHGIPADKIIQAKSPYLVDSYKTQFDQENSMVIFAVGGKDADRFPMNNVDDTTGLDMTVRGEARPKYYQMINTLKAHPVLPMSQRGYVYNAPTISDGDSVASASAFRDAFISAPDDGSRKEIFTKYMGEFNNNIYTLFTNKLMGKKMKTENAYKIDVIKYLSGMLNEAPIDFGDYDDEEEMDDTDTDGLRPGFKQDSMVNQLGKISDSGEASKDADQLMKKGKEFNVSSSVTTDDGETFNLTPAEADALLQMFNMLSAQRAGEEESPREKFTRSIQASKGLESMLGFAKSKGLVKEEGKILPQVDLGDIRNDYAVEGDLEEGKMKDVIIDAQQSSKEEFDAKYNGEWNYDEILADYPVEEANNPDAGEYTYTLDYSGESQGYTTHTLTITSPEGESKVVADDFTYFEVEGDELQAELHSWFNMGHGVGDEGLGEADGPEDQEESFDPAMEPSHYDSEFERMYAAYENGGEPELAEFLGMSDRELDQEMTEYAMDHNLHMDDDRDEVIQGYLEQLIDNADHKDMGAQMAQYESQLVQLKKLAGI